MTITLNDFQTAAAALNAAGIEYYCLSYLEKLKFLNQSHGHGAIFEFWMKLHHTKEKVSYFKIPTRPAELFTGSVRLALKGVALTDSINMKLVTVRYNKDRFIILDDRKLDGQGTNEFIRKCGFDPISFYRWFDAKTIYYFATVEWVG